MKKTSKLLAAFLVIFIICSSVSVLAAPAADSNVIIPEAEPDETTAPSLDSISFDEAAKKPGSLWKPGLLGEYYNYSELTPSSLEMKRIDSRVNFSWGYTTPDPVIEPETYSVRWTGYIVAPKTDNYTFKTLSDDGVRITIGCCPVIDRWGLVSMEYTISNPVRLRAGNRYCITIEYQQVPLNATLVLFWESSQVPMEIIPSSAFYVGKSTYQKYNTPQYYNEVSKSGTGLNNSFFAQNPLDSDSSEFAEQAFDTNNVNYDWSGGAPDGITQDVFYGTMAGYMECKYTEFVTLSFIVDDGIKVWIDGQLLIDEWGYHSGEEITCSFFGVAGQQLSIQIEYCDFSGSATCIMRWESESQELEIVPIEYLYAE